MIEPDDSARRHRTVTMSLVQLVFPIQRGIPHVRAQNSFRLHPVVVWMVGMSITSTCLSARSAAAAQVKPDSVAATLDRIHKATDQPDSSRPRAELLIEGKAQRSGSTSRYTLRFAPEGRFLQTIDGPLAGTIGFNGKDCWSTDLSGMPEHLVLHDLDRNRLLLGIQTGQWLSGDDATSIALAKTKGAPTRSCSMSSKAD